MRNIIVLPFRKLTILTLISLASTSNFAVADDAKSEVSKHAANYFAELYSKTCVQYGDDLNALKEQLTQASVPELSEAKAKLFLENKPGTVWIIPNVYGDMLLSIDTKNTCTVYSRHLNINHIEKAFIAEVESGPASLIYHKVQEETVQSKLGPQHVIRYVMTNTATNSKKNYQLTTSTADRVEAQIKAIVSDIE